MGCMGVDDFRQRNVKKREIWDGKKGIKEVVRDRKVLKCMFGTEYQGI